MSQSGAYQLTILPGLGNAAVAQCPTEILKKWLSVDGDNYEEHEFFTPQLPWTAADNRYQRPFTEQEMSRRDADGDFIIVDGWATLRDDADSDIEQDTDGEIDQRFWTPLR